MGKRKLFVEYNEDARRDYLLGFHKRKQQRRKDAINREEEMMKSRLKVERAEVRFFFVFFNIVLVNKRGFRSFTTSHHPSPLPVNLSLTFTLIFAPFPTHFSLMAFLSLSYISPYYVHDIYKSPPKKAEKKSSHRISKGGRGYPRSVE